MAIENTVWLLKKSLCLSNQCYVLLAFYPKNISDFETAAAAALSSAGLGLPPGFMPSSAAAAAASMAAAASGSSGSNPTSGAAASSSSSGAVASGASGTRSKIFFSEQFCLNTLHFRIQ